MKSVIHMRLKRISDLRTDADLSCAALARLIGVTDRTMLRYEKEKLIFQLKSSSV